MSPIVLIVDDEPQILTLMQLILEDEGYTTIQCLNGEQAKEIMQDVAVNLVILDLNLQGTSGRDVERYIEDNKLDTPIIFMTGAPSAEALTLKNSCKERDDRRFMYKPIIAKKLYEAARTLLSKNLNQSA